MAVLKLKAKQQTDDYRKRPLDDHGKLRVQYFTLDPTTEAGDANTTIELCELPPSAVRIMPYLCRVQTSGFGAGRTLDIGHDAYQARPIDRADEVADDPDAFADGLDVSAAGIAAFGTGLKFDVYSLAGIVVKATVLGGTIPVGAALEGVIVYVYE